MALQVDRLIRQSFDVEGRIVALEDSSHNFLHFTYSSGRLDEISDSGGRSLKFSYGANTNQVSEVTSGVSSVSTWPVDVNR